MANDSLTNGRATTAAAIGRHCPVREGARLLLRDDIPSTAFVHRLRERRLYEDAVRFLAHALGKREAVWWACLCARHAAAPEPAGAPARALEAAETWVREPTDENRRAALPAGETAGFGTPAGCAAVAAFWSGGSLGPPNVPPIPPGEYLTAQGVAGAVLLAAVGSEPHKAAERYETFLARGIEVADGTSRWKEAANPAS